MRALVLGQMASVRTVMLQEQDGSAPFQDGNDRQPFRRRDGGAHADTTACRPDAKRRLSAVSASVRTYNVVRI